MNTIAVALALEWAATLLVIVPQQLSAAHAACGLPCVATRANELQLSAPMLDQIYQLPPGTAAQAFAAQGLRIRGMP